MRLSVLSIDHSVVEKAVALGLAASRVEAEAVLRYALDQSAICTSPHGNRRFGSLYFKYVHGLIRDVELVGRWCGSCGGTGIVTVPNGTMSCEDCRQY